MVCDGLKGAREQKEAKEILAQRILEFEEEQTSFINKLKNRTKPKNVDKAEATMLFSDYCLKYVESKKPELSPSVYSLYLKHYIKLFKSYFDSKKLRLIDITEKEINDFYEDRLKHGVKKITLKHYNCVLRPALRQAYRNKLIPDNPFDFIDSIKKEKATMSFYDKNEMKLFFAAIKGHKLEIPFILAAYYGFRRSEVLGLRWSAIDFEHKLITVKSHRTLPLIPAVESALLKHKAQIEENKRFYGNTYDARYLDYVCVEENGKIVYPDHMTKKFADLLKEKNLRHIRLHDLRHSCASNLLANGVQLKEIQEWLGHSNFGTTADVYSHLDFSAKVKAAKTLTQAYDEPAEEKPPTQDRKNVEILMQAIDEMKKLGFDSLEEYLAYKDEQSLKEMKKSPIEM